MSNPLTAPAAVPETSRATAIAENAADAIVLAPCTGARFSGIDATMLAVIPAQRREIAIASWGRRLGENVPHTSLIPWLFRRERRDAWRVWHSRRANDLWLGVFLRHVLRRKIVLVWTAAGERKFSRATHWLLGKVDAIAATTSRVATHLRRPAEIIPHGVNPSVYRPAADRSAVRAELGIADRPTLGVFGRVREAKGTGDLVEALLRLLPQFPQWQVTIVGAATRQHFPFQRKLEAELARHGLADRVRFTGFTPHDQMPQWYQACDLVGCVSWHEGFGVTCLEAMASGVPVVATRAGGWPDIIDEGETGWLCEPRNPADLERALRIALATPMSELGAMGERGRRHVTEYHTVEQEAARLNAVYRRLLARFNGPVSDE